MRARRRGWLGVALACVAWSGAVAQDRPALQLSLPPPDSLTEAGPLVRATNVLAVSSTRELLDHGFPARLTWVVELWSTAGFFDRRVRSVTWDVVLRFDPARRLFEAVRVIDDRATPIGTFPRLIDAVAEIERAERAPIRPPRADGGSWYYTASLALEMLSVSDLDELERWVRGDLNPAVRGRRNPGTALGRGARTLLSRLLGGERRTIETRSGTFRLR